MENLAGSEATILVYSCSIEFPTFWIKKFLTSGEQGFFDQDLVGCGRRGDRTKAKLVPGNSCGSFSRLV
jgi:hypothetical protein